MKGVLIKEQMSGWLQLDNEPDARDFSFNIEAFTPHIFRLQTPRYFTGTAWLSGEGECRVSGTLTLHPGGPEYQCELHTRELGILSISGRKTYRLNNLHYSLTHCPLTVSQHGQRKGVALLAYRDSVLAFPFRALSLCDAPDWYNGREVLV